MSDRTNESVAAAALIATHGHQARQKVVDHMVAAIRAHDLSAAKRWDEIGRVVDLHLIAA